MVPQICTKMLKTLSEKLRTKFLATAHGYSMVKFARLDEAFLTASKPSKRPITAAKGEEKEKTKENTNFKNLKA